MVMKGKLPRFVVATPEQVRRMSDERKKAAKLRGTGDPEEDLRQQLAGPRGGGLKRKKRKGKWA